MGDALQERAIIKAEIRLDTLRECLADIEAAGQDGGKLMRRWTDFLMAHASIYTALEQGAKSDGRSLEWFKWVKDLRKSDELLRYVHHARNAEEHGLEFSAKDWAPKLGVRMPPHQRAILTPEQRKGKSEIREYQDAEGCNILEYKVSHPGLILVIDRGVTYRPPTIHLGVAVNGASISEVASHALKYGEDLVAYARTLLAVGPQSP